MGRPGGDVFDSNLRSPEPPIAGHSHRRRLLLDVDAEIRKYLQESGRKGGKASRRSLDPRTASRMVAVREAWRAYRRFHASCFWSSPPDLEIGMDDVEWVARQLMKQGDREAWLAFPGFRAPRAWSRGRAQRTRVRSGACRGHRSQSLHTAPDAEPNESHS